MLVELKNIKKSYPVSGRQEKMVLNGVNLAVKDGELLAIMGRSGCGKSTLLNILGAFLLSNK